MSEKQTNPEEKVTPEEYLESVSGHAGRCYPAATIVHYKNALKAVALARKEGEERIESAIGILENMMNNCEGGEAKGIHRAIRLLKGLLPEKGDNNGKE